MAYQYSHEQAVSPLIAGVLRRTPLLHEALNYLNGCEDASLADLQLSQRQTHQLTTAAAAVLEPVIAASPRQAENASEFTENVVDMADFKEAKAIREQGAATVADVPDIADVSNLADAPVIELSQAERVEQARAELSQVYDFPEGV